MSSPFKSYVIAFWLASAPTTSTSGGPSAGCHHVASMNPPPPFQEDPQVGPRDVHHEHVRQATAAEPLPRDE